MADDENLNVWSTYISEDEHYDNRDGFDNSSYYDDYKSGLDNGTIENNTVVLHALGYSTVHIVISSIVLTFMMIVVVIGNMLVIIAIATEKSLKNLQNWFIASLAVADFFVGLLIMPFSLANELMGYWIFGTVWCSIHSAMDVLLCTSSIMNICLISLDRYWSITQAVDYLKKRTPARAAVMIGMVWLLSALISIPPLLGWSDPNVAADDPVPICQISKEIGYVIYSALGSFYIPSCIMVFVYIRIYFAARARARRAVRKQPKPKPQLTAIEIEDDTNRGGRPSASSSSKSKEKKKASTKSGHGSSSSVPNTPDAKTVKQVGFQEPIKSELMKDQPKITVQTCSPDETRDSAQSGCSQSEEVVGMSGEGKSREEGKAGGSGSEVGEVDDSKETCGPVDAELSSGDGKGKDEGTGPITASTITAASTSTASGSTENEVNGGCEGKRRDGGTRDAEGKGGEEEEEEEGNGGVCRDMSKDNGCWNEYGRKSHQHLVPTIELKQVEEKAKDTASSSNMVVSQLLETNIPQTNVDDHCQGAVDSNDDSCVALPRTKLKEHKGSTKRPSLHFLRVEKTSIWRTSSSLSLNGDVHILGTLSRSCSRLQLEGEPVSDVEPSSSDSGAASRCAVVKPLKLRLCQPFFGKRSNAATNKVRRDVLDMGKLPPSKELRDPEREKRRIARKKEKRATLILGLIMGSFILCWLPFFFLYILEPLCPSCQVAPWGFSIAFWLGYMNSALNPVIYTIFNKDFRRAFRRILFK